MTKQLYHNPSQAERRAVVENDQRVGVAYSQIAASEAGTIGGRFAAEVKTRVTGATPSPAYPTLPSSSPWAARDLAI